MLGALDQASVYYVELACCLGAKKCSAVHGQAMQCNALVQAPVLDFIVPIGDAFNRYICG